MVVFPAPVSPIRATLSPSFMEKLTFSSMLFLFEYEKDTFENFILPYNFSVFSPW